MIDLHLHTTASDGRSTPEGLVAEAAAAGITTLAVTDHDTVAAVDAVRAAAHRAGLAMIAGIEITAIHAGKDVHVLGYFLDATDPELAAFLVEQRASRRQRVTEILARLDALGVSVEGSPFLAGFAVEADASVGRPLVAQALVAAGHATDVADAFDRYLATGRPAFVPRIGPSVRDVVERVARARGVSSLAHPAKIENDDLVRAFVRDEVDAIEVHHPDHDEAAVARYRELAASAGRLVTGGSDYHGPGSGRTAALGRVGLPPADFARLTARLAERGGRAR
ncbi:MAG TPA: PHP domain-containing protein [Vicinamibacterales bacterium]|nr:PHP domain-containing protein [Vicinamibacterales bacterium]